MFYFKLINDRVFRLAVALCALYSFLNYLKIIPIKHHKMINRWGVEYEKSNLHDFAVSKNSYPFKFVKEEAERLLNFKTIHLVHSFLIQSWFKKISSLSIKMWENGLKIDVSYR